MSVQGKVLQCVSKKEGGIKKESVLSVNCLLFMSKKRTADHQPVDQLVTSAVSPQSLTDDTGALLPPARRQKVARILA